MNERDLTKTDNMSTSSLNEEETIAEDATFVYN